MITAEPKPNIKPLNLGFLGVGWIGKNRMEAIRDSKIGTVKMIFDASAESAASAKESAPEAYIASSPQELFNEDSLDGIVIATPSALHAEQTLQALSNGFSVFCQKPLGRTAAEVQQLVEASKAQDKLLAVDLSYRYTAAFQAVHQVITSGGIGKVYAVDLVFHNAYGPDKSWFYDIAQSGGGCVMDLGIHLIDLALFSLGFPEIQELSSSLFSNGRLLEKGEPQVEDFAMAQLLTFEGVIINLQCSWNVSAGRDAVIEARFYGNQGGAAFRNVNGSFYDFVAELFHGTQTETLVSPPDQWSGRAGVVWAEKVARGASYDPVSASEYLATAKVIDRIYGR